MKRPNPDLWVSSVPYGLDQQKPNHYLEMMKVARDNSAHPKYAWDVLTKGVCDGCALGVAGLHDWTIDGVHLCTTRLRLLELNEVNFELLRRYIGKGELPTLAALLSRHGLIETSSEAEYEHLEPWIQWVTAHTGKTFAEHGVFRLGDIVEELGRAPADVVVASETLFGAMIGAGAAGVPCVALAANVYLFPRPGVPPFGPGLLPARTVVGRVRDWVIRTIALREFGKATTAFNETRHRFGLSPVKHPFDQLQRLAAHLVLTSAAFDFCSTSPPPRVIYAGPELEDPHWTGSWRSPWDASDRRPLVLVGFSSTYQNQGVVLARVIEALRTLDVRAVITTGPAIDVTALPAAPNVHVCTSAPHSVVLREARAAVTHAGHGTVIRALAAGVPLVCMPMGRDQNDTAARVVFHGAGVRLAPTAPAHKIRASVHEVLGYDRYRESARALGALIREDARTSKAVPVLESIADGKGTSLNDQRRSVMDRGSR